MNVGYIIPLLKDYVTAESAEQIEDILQQLSEAVGIDKELVFDSIHCVYPHLHDAVIAELKQENIIRSIPILPLF